MQAPVVRTVVLLPFSDPDPAETARREVALVPAWTEGAASAIAVGDAGWDALELDVERLVLIGTPPRDEEVPDVAAKTLLLYRQADSKDARWWKRQIPHARFEISPREGDLLANVWSRALAFAAPGTLRKG